jgi:hypothetical protein
MTLLLHRNGDRWEINPILNCDAGLVQHNESIVLIADIVGEVDNRVPKALRRLVRVEAGVVFYGMSPINRAVQLKEFIRRAANVVICLSEIEIVKVQRESSLNERIVIEGNQNYGFFALPELLDITNQAGVVAREVFS